MHEGVSGKRADLRLLRGLQAPHGGPWSVSGRNRPNDRDGGNKLGSRQPEQVPQCLFFPTHRSTDQRRQQLPVLTPTDGPGLQRLLEKAFLPSFLEIARDVGVTVL